MDEEKPGVAVITGASSGIGESFARILSSQGFDLVITARRTERLESLAADLKQKNGTNVEIITGDLSKPEFMDKVASHIENIKNLDVLVNNAGFGGIGDFISKCHINFFLTKVKL